MRCLQQRVLSDERSDVDTEISRSSSELELESGQAATQPKWKIQVRNQSHVFISVNCIVCSSNKMEDAGHQQRRPRRVRRGRG